MTVEIEWDAIDRARWEDRFRSIARSNLLQSWAYGEARERAEGFRARRGVVRRNGTEIALIQALERRERALGYLGTVVRINRGPLWLNPPDAPAVQATAAALRRLGRWWQGRAIVLVPELLNEGQPADMLRQTGYRRLRTPAWRSAWIDLAQPEPELWKRLDGKWRNMVNAARKRSLEVVVDDGAGAFDWLLERYAEFRQQRGFGGPSVALLKALRTAAEPAALQVLRARVGNEWVAGVLIVGHGSAATYLVGWSSDEGRKARANNALLWTALGELAKRGCRWFDLGGIDDVGTPGVAEFKRGMGGDEYALCGTYLSF